MSENNWKQIGEKLADEVGARTDAQRAWLQLRLVEGAILRQLNPGLAREADRLRAELAGPGGEFAASPNAALAIVQSAVRAARKLERQEKS